MHLQGTKAARLDWTGRDYIRRGLSDFQEPRHLIEITYSTKLSSFQSIISYANNNVVSEKYLNSGSTALTSGKMVRGVALHHKRPRGREN